MGNPRKLEHLDRLLGEEGGRKTNELEDALRETPDRFLRNLDTLLDVIDWDQDPVREWKDQLRQEKFTDAIAELVLVYLLRQTFDQTAVTVKPPLEETKRDFDIRVDINGETIWIEVTNERFEERYTLGGFNSPTKSAEKIDRKIAAKMEELSSAVADDDTVILALYTEAAPVQQLTIGTALSKEAVSWEETIDGLVTFAAFAPTNVSLKYDPLTSAGKDAETHFTEVHRTAETL